MTESSCGVAWGDMHVPVCPRPGGRKPGRASLLLLETKGLLANLENDYSKSEDLMRQLEGLLSDRIEDPPPVSLHVPPEPQLAASCGLESEGDEADQQGLSRAERAEAKHFVQQRCKPYQQTPTGALVGRRSSTIMVGEVFLRSPVESPTCRPSLTIPPAQDTPFACPSSRRALPPQLYLSHLPQIPAHTVSPKTPMSPLISSERPLTPSSAFAAASASSVLPSSTGGLSALLSKIKGPFTRGGRAQQHEQSPRNMSKAALHTEHLLARAKSDVCELRHPPSKVSKSFVGSRTQGMLQLAQLGDTADGVVCDITLDAPAYKAYSNQHNINPYTPSRPPPSGGLATSSPQQGMYARRATPRNASCSVVAPYGQQRSGDGSSRGPSMSGATRSGNSSLDGGALEPLFGGGAGRLSYDGPVVCGSLPSMLCALPSVGKVSGSGVGPGCMLPPTPVGSTRAKRWSVS